jgi:5,10-methylenetetrahydromethanopterin reductase
MIRASINIMPEVPVAEVVDLARHAADLGFARCWVYDEGLAARDVYVTLTAIADATDRVQLGPGITNPFTRHPGVTAAAIATLDELSAGRAFLGIGAGGSLTLDPLGIEHRYSLTAVRDTIHACRGLFSGEPVDYSGRYFGLAGARLEYARADTEIWLAGRGPRMLALGGEIADGVMLEFIHRALLDRELTRVREAAAAAGNRPAISYSTMIVTDEATMAMTKPHMTYRLVDSPDVVKEQMGIGDAEVERIRSAMAGGIAEAGKLIRDEWVVPFVIAGSIEECAAQIRLLDDAGIDEFLLPILQADGAVALMDSLAEMMAQL